MVLTRLVIDQPVGGHNGINSKEVPVPVRAVIDRPMMEWDKSDTITLHRLMIDHILGILGNRLPGRVIIHHLSREQRKEAVMSSLDRRTAALRTNRPKAVSRAGQSKIPIQHRRVVIDHLANRSM
jgi:hypothetical protein